MPSDRNINTSRPLKPTLAANRTAKSPITPRLAPSIASAGSFQSPRVARNDAGTETVLDKPFISSNVTPRSSARLSRVGTASPQSTPIGTPTSTPITTKPLSIADIPQKELVYGNSGAWAAVSTAPQPERPRSMAAAHNHALKPLSRQPPHNDGGARDSSSMFFHADAVRLQVQQQPPPQKKAVFFYANGKEDMSSLSGDTASPVYSSPGATQSESKFFHADAIPETRSAPPTRPLSRISTLPDTKTMNGAILQHPNIHSDTSTNDLVNPIHRQNTSPFPRAPTAHPSVMSVLSSPRTPESGIELPRRKSSAASSIVRFGHNKSGSLPNVDPATVPNEVLSKDSPTTTQGTVLDQAKVNHLERLPESVAQALTQASADLAHLPPQQPASPIKGVAGQTPLEHMNELAANARRERKVLDLEISNSSLLAINRSLEKEMRKQTAELRRLRRLSRAGRFSAEATIAITDDYSILSNDDVNDLSGMSGVDLQLEEEMEESDSSMDDGTLSPTALEQRDEARRIRDEKRLQLDLSKHKELLIDSQKMNQSLKRCMTWTEELIKDAQKALAYKVHVSDVQLGGRVLNSEEHFDEHGVHESKALLSPWTPSQGMTDPFDADPTLTYDQGNRDSGIDMNGAALVEAISDLLDSQEQQKDN